MFGLKIVTRNCPQVYRLFEFDIDEYISFSQMRQMLKLPNNAVDTWTAEQWVGLLKQYTVMELRMVESETDDQGWGELARNLLNSFS